MAWKSADAVFLVADSAVTSGKSPANSSSSFGELHCGRGTVYVEQRALKVLPAGATGFTFAGPNTVGFAVFDGYAANLAKGESTKSAFTSAVASVQPLSHGVNLGAIVASIEGGAPSILCFDSETGLIEASREIVRFGSLKEQKAARIEEVALRLARDKRMSAGAQLAIIVAYLQSHSINSPAIEEGVGGHFIGALFDKRGAHWQPDMIYSLYDSADIRKDFYSVTSIVRDNVACINSGLTNDTRCFAVGKNAVQLAAWKDKWLSEAVNFSQRGICDYMVFLDTRRWRIVVVEMAGHPEHRLLRNVPAADGESWALTGLSDELITQLMKDTSDEMTLTFHPHAPPVMSKTIRRGSE